MVESLTPETFQETMSVPEMDYRSAIAIKHSGRMATVSVRFVLQSRNDNVANYTAKCPRCQEGEIGVAVPLKPDGSFAEPPACPMLCLACEDRMDAILEPARDKDARTAPSDRAGLNHFIRNMNSRSWD